MAQETQEVVKNHNSYVYADIFQATVVSVDPGTNVIIVAPDGLGNHDQLQGIPLVSTFSAALGFVETMLPTLGTRVLCCGRTDKQTYIIGSVPYPDNQAAISNPSLPNKAILGTLEPLFQSVHKNGYLDKVTKAFIHNNNLPSDVLQGEKVISNEFGVMLGLFKLMATLKGSELAQIQCHFLDDLVRIVSHNFQHYSSLGELNVFHDGKGIHLEMGATHIPAESLGQAGDGVSGVTKTAQVDGYNQFYTLNEEQSTMLERMKVFVGQLGQFVNLLITYPSQEGHALDGNPPNTPDLGLLQFKAGLDGTLVVRSVSGIYLEKTNWIRVPTRIRAADDPLGDDGTTITYPKQAAYTFDTQFQYRNTAFLYYLQLRDYLAYINEEVGYANFNAHTKDFYVNNDVTKEKPIQSITYVDPETGVAYTQTKSWISLMGNGGISLADAWGSCISMEGGNIYIQPAKDLVVQPNRNLVGKIGGSIAVAARKEIDLSSTEGGLRVKTANAQYLYSKGGIVLHTDGPNYEGNYITWDGDPDSMITNVAGLLLLAPQSSVNAYSQQIYLDATDSLFAKSDSIALNATSDAIIASNNETILYGNEISILSKEATINYSSGESILLGLTSTIIGQKNQYFGMDSLGGGVEGFLDPNNNQDSIFFSDLASELSTITSYVPADFLGSFQTDSDFTDIQFQFPPTDLYALDPVADVIPQTLSQQTDNFTSMYNLQTWAEQSVNNSYPYPGSDFNMALVTAVVNNIDADANNGIPITNSAEDLTSQSNMVVQDIFQNYQSM